MATDALFWLSNRDGFVSIFRPLDRRKARGMLQVSCVTQGGICAMNCPNRYGLSDKSPLVGGTLEFMPPILSPITPAAVLYCQLPTPISGTHEFRAECDHRLCPFEPREDAAWNGAAQSHLKALVAACRCISSQVERGLDILGQVFAWHEVLQVMQEPECTAMGTL